MLGDYIGVVLDDYIGIVLDDYMVLTHEGTILRLNRNCIQQTTNQMFVIQLNASMKMQSSTQSCQSFFHFE